MWRPFFKMKNTHTILILCVLLGLLSSSNGSSAPSGHHTVLTTFVQEEINRQEFTAFCELGFMIRENPEELADSEECAVVEPNEFDKDEDLQMLFTLIMICAYGAFIRAVTRHFKIGIPYTVVLLISGLIFGGFSHIAPWCPEIHKYTAIARISPQHILYIFLPILIFESAFSIPVHTFMKSCSQILLLAFPGMVLSSFATALICWQFFSSYKWEFLHACLFGCIVSATDPVAVVAILRDLGVSEQLSVLIDGESLMNDGVAILLFEIFHEYIVHPPEGGVTDTIVHVIMKFFQIAVGGPIFGWIVARAVIFLLGYVYNDPAVEISATICAAYLTYWGSEFSLKVSGVMAVVVLGITMSNERTVISPESEGPVHHFWEMLGYLANTVLFVLVGIVISETALVSVSIEDFTYLILLYTTLHVVRLMMLLMFYPILKRLGYGLKWENMIIIMWGGLRGAVGICLALQIYQDTDLCSEINLGPKILLHTAGIVFLTLVINGTTTKGLLQTLKLTDVTSGQKEEMNNAVRRISMSKWRNKRCLQGYKYMMDARWEVVDANCKIANPYSLPQAEDPTKSIGPQTLHPPMPILDNTTLCWHCNSVVVNEPTIMDYREMTNDARLRVIKAMKVDYLHQFEKGTLTENAVQVLLADAENAEDKYLSIIQAHNFHKYMKIHGFYPWFRDNVIVRFRLHKEESEPEAPVTQWRKGFHRLITQGWFDALCIFVVLFNMIPIIWDFFITMNTPFQNDPCNWTPSEQHAKDAFHYTNYCFCSFYTLEIVLKLLGLKLKLYIRDPWNYLDIVVLIISYIDLYLNNLGCETAIIQSGFQNYFKLLVSIKLVRVLRIIRLLRPMTPRLLRQIKNATNGQVFIGYDIGKGFVQSSDDVLKFIPQIVENKKVQSVIRHAMERERNCCVKDLALIQNKFPGVAVALKTRHACRAVLNQMKISLNDVKDDGMLDDNEVLLLRHILEGKMKRLTHSPPYVAPTKPLTLQHIISTSQDNISKETNAKSDDNIHTLKSPPTNNYHP